MIRTCLVIVVLALVILNGSCSNLVKVSDSSIPRLLTPLAETKFDDLIAQLQPLANLKSLRSSNVYIRFNDAESAERYREAEAILALKRPDNIRLIIQLPVVKTKVVEMASELNHFTVAIYPSDYRRFLVGTNDADYSKWRERLGDKGKSALISARPFHFTESLMIRPLKTNDPNFIYSIEEAMVEEADSRNTAKKGAHVLRSFYVVSELETVGAGRLPARVRRRFWFDRTSASQFARQQIFDDQNQLVTDVYYSNYKNLNGGLWPSVILVSRPHDGYSARLTFNEERFEIDPELPANAFTLKNTDSLPEIDLDKPMMP